MPAGVVASIISVILGLLLARNGDYGKDTLNLHQWTGIATAGFGSLSLFFLFKILGKNRYDLIKPYRAILLLSGVGVCVAGHFGASLTHGNDYLSAAIPWSNDYEATPIKNFDFASYKADTVKLNKKEQL